MKKLILISTVLVALFMSGCKKSNEMDYASQWEGVYLDANTVPNTGNNSSIKNIVISKVNGSTLKIVVKAIETNYIYTFTTLQSVSINGATKATIDENEGVAESIGQYHIKGTLTLTDDNVILSATASPMNSDISKETDVKTLSFSGKRK